MPEDNPNVDEQLEGPMPWIGMYAAVASSLCTLAMAADVFHGFRSRKYWFPSKYFSLNATTLALLALAPASRWFVAINHRTSAGWRNNIENAFTVEGYWTQKLVEWQHSSLSLEIQHLKSRKAVHGLRRLFLKLCISVQHLIVLASKLVLVVSICLAKPIKACLDYIRHKKICASDSGSSSSQEVDIRRYVIQLQGEVELPKETLRNMFKEMDEIIKKGKMRKSKNLLNLLSKSCNFKGVMEFDSHQVPSLHPHCWSLPVVTLACIARAIPNVEKDKSERLLGGVIENVKLIDKLVDRKGQLAKTRAAANRVSELNGKWQKKDLDQISVKGKNAEDILRQLHQDSKRTVLEFKRNLQNGVYWPPEVIAANSMYRVSKTILLSHSHRGDDETDEQLFERLWEMIADIVAACLTNLAHAIIIKCHRSAIEERESC